MTAINFDPSHLNLCIDFRNGDCEMRQFIIADEALPMDYEAIDHSIWVDTYQQILCDDVESIDEYDLEDMMVRFPSANDPTCR